ncbi:MAG: TIM barrel protein [Bacteroidetes bacterium]|nr:TIM barrel protein [Bacteroidota bacterium]
MREKSSIKRGVSLYSFQEEYFLRKMSLEDCIAKAASFGAKGIEIIGEQMVPGFPKLTDAFLEQWFGWMKKYDAVPVCHDMFLDFKKFKGKILSKEEQLQSIIRDLQFANKLGCKVIRVIVSTSPELMELAAPYAEKYDVKMGIEVHSPWHIDNAWMKKHYETMEKTKSPYLGFIPDMGTYTKRLPRVLIENLLRKGADEKIATYVTEAYEKGVLSEYIVGEVRSMTSKPIDLMVAEQTRFYSYTNPRQLLPYMDRIFHIHAKFYEMLEDETEYSIPYEEVIEVLKLGGYNGYLSSEYEGNRHIQDVYEVDSVEQVRRQQAMFKKLLGE